MWNVPLMFVKYTISNNVKCSVYLILCRFGQVNQENCSDLLTNASPNVIWAPGDNNQKIIVICPENDMTSFQNPNLVESHALASKGKTTLLYYSLLLL